MSNELDNLETIDVNSRRGGGQNFDIQHDVENQKFTVSDAFYSANNMNDNGFTAHVGNGNVYLSVQANEDSVSYRGREGYDKGKQFTATAMSELFEKMGLPENISLVHIGEKNGAEFFRAEAVEDASNSEEITDEEIASDENDQAITENATVESEREYAESVAENH